MGNLAVAALQVKIAVLGRAASVSCKVPGVREILCSTPGRARGSTRSVTEARKSPVVRRDGPFSPFSRNTPWRHWQDQSRSGGPRKEPQPYQTDPRCSRWLGRWPQNVCFHQCRQPSILAFGQTSRRLLAQGRKLYCPRPRRVHQRTSSETLTCLHSPPDTPPQKSFPTSLLYV